MIHDAASLLNDVLSDLAGLGSNRTTFDDPSRMTWARRRWTAAFTLFFFLCIAAASAFAPALSRLLGL